MVSSKVILVDMGLVANCHSNFMFGLLESFKPVENRGFQSKIANC